MKKILSQVFLILLLSAAFGAVFAYGFVAEYSREKQNYKIEKYLK